MFISAEFLRIVIGIVAVAVIVIGILIIRYDALNTRATTYLRESLAYYRATHKRELTVPITQDIFRELYNLNQYYVSGRFWHEDYVNLLEFFIAISDDSEAQAQLIHGSHMARRNPERNLCFRSLIWVQYRYAGRTWVLWIDPMRNDPSDFSIRNDGYRMFRHLGGRTRVESSQLAAKVRQVYDRHI